MTSAVIAVALLAAAVNFVVDPYYLFDALTVDGFNKGKPATVNRTGFAKTYMVQRVNPNTVILGASRVDVGLDPNDPGWRDDQYPVFNFGVPGADIYGRLRYMQHAVAVHKPALVIVSLDFGQFLHASAPLSETYPPAVQEFEKRLLVTYEDRPTPSLGLQHAKDMAASLFSTTGVIDSFNTVRDQQYVSPTALGFSSGEQRFGREIADKGSYSVMRDVSRTIAGRTIRNGTFVSDVDRSPDFRALRDILAFARDKGIQVILFVPPSHVFEYEIWDRFGLWDDFELWKRLILQEVDTSNMAIAAQVDAAETPPAAFWDFSGYWPENIEPVPEPGDRSKRMKWFWEPVHFTNRLGARVIATIMGTEPRSYGRQLEASQFCKGILEERQAKAQYRREYPRQIQMLDEILTKANLNPSPHGGSVSVSTICTP